MTNPNNLQPETSQVKPESDEAGVFTNMSGIYSSGQVNMGVYLSAAQLAKIAATCRFAHSGLLARMAVAVPVEQQGPETDTASADAARPEVNE